MAVITSLLRCPGGSALAGPWEYTADSHGLCCPAQLLLLRFFVMALRRHAGSMGAVIKHSRLIAA